MIDSPMIHTEIIRHRAVIAGYVTDAITGQAVPGAVVRLIAPERETRADHDGFYFFLDLPEASYTLEVSAAHFGTRYGAVTIANVVVQNDAAGRPDFDPLGNAALPPTRLTGTVTSSADGLPIQKAEVRLLGGEKKTLTDSAGTYVLSALQAGSPNAQASAEGYGPGVQQVSLTAGNETIADFVLVPV